VVVVATPGCKDYCCMVTDANVTGCWCISHIVCVKTSNKHKQTALDLDQKITALLPHGIIKDDDDDDWHLQCA